MESINSRLIQAVRKGNLQIVRELIDSYGLSYSSHWADGYALLLSATENKHNEIIKLLLKSHARVNKKNNKKRSNTTNTPLHFAVKNGDIEIVEMILNRCADVNAKGNGGWTSLYQSVIDGKIEITKLLLNDGADVDASDDGGISPLHLAAQAGYLQIAEDLLNHGAYTNPVCEWRDGYTPLHLASENCREEVVKLLLSKDADINANAKNCATPLYIAVNLGHETIVKLLLEHGANVNTQSKNGDTILNLAVQKGHSVIVEHILKHRPDVNNYYNKSSLNSAIQGNQNAIVENLLKYGFNVDSDDVNNCKLLHAAVKNGCLKIVKELLKYGADVNMSHMSKKGYTLLHNATEEDQQEIAILLINFGADVNAKDETEIPPLFYAIKNVNLKLVKMFLTKGAIVEDCPELLHTAVKNESKEIVEILLGLGVNINGDDKSGRTPLHFTGLNKYGFPVNKNPDENVKVEIARLLLSKGADFNAKSNDGTTVLQAAIQGRHVKVVEALLEYEVDLISTEKNGITPLHLSVEDGSVVISKMLLNKGANVNASQINGKTALHIATEKRLKKLIEVLLKYGAKIDSEDSSRICSRYGASNANSKGITPLYIAIQSGYKEIVELLLKYGASIDFEKNRALQIAAQKGSREIVENLLEFGVDIDEKDAYGRIALHIAVKKKDIQIVNVLLEHGSDINMSVNRDTPLSFSWRAAFYLHHYSDNNIYDPLDRYLPSSNIMAEFLEKHVIKMKFANLYQSKGNDELFRSNYKMRNFENWCEEEIKVMKNEKISNNISFYDVLSKSKLYVRNENIVQVLKSDNYKTKFPIYAGMIKGYFKMAMVRKRLFEESNPYLNSLFCSELPNICAEIIISHLTNKDLRKLIQACKL